MSARVCPGQISRSGIHGRRSTTGSAAGRWTPRSTGSSTTSLSKATRSGRSSGRCRSTRRSCVPTSTPRVPRMRSRRPERASAHQRAHRGHRPAGGSPRPPSGRLTSKIHAAVDGQGRPLSLPLTARQINDFTQLEQVMDGIRVRRDGPGRPRTRPDHVLADNGYSSRAIREELRRRNIGHTIPAHDPRTRSPHATTRKPTQTARIRRRTPTDIRHRAIQAPQRRRTVLQPAQAMARTHDPVHPARPLLPQRTHTRRDLHLARRSTRDCLAGPTGAGGFPCSPARLLADLPTAAPRPTPDPRTPRPAER
ncbi:hypothetical protein FAGKG844_220014 [Frankia sp. AgKG'84/4]